MAKDENKEAKRRMVEADRAYDEALGLLNEAKKRKVAAVRTYDESVNSWNDAEAKLLQADKDYNRELIIKRNEELQASILKLTEELNTNRYSSVYSHCYCC